MRFSCTRSNMRIESGLVPLERETSRNLGKTLIAVVRQPNQVILAFKNSKNINFLMMDVEGRSRSVRGELSLEMTVINRRLSLNFKNS